jgi:hypothetical protein
MTVLQNELEKFYDANGVYPPGCPITSCTTWFLTDNTSSPMINGATTLATVRSTLPGLSDKFGDPGASTNATPIMNIGAAAVEYYYYGGTVDNQASSSSFTYASSSYFPCSIKSTLSPGQAGSYVIGYFSEATQSWVLWGGKHGVPFSVTTGGCVINT